MALDVSAVDAKLVEATRQARRLPTRAAGLRPPAPRPGDQRSEAEGGGQL
jgi:hypothetical protein